MGSNVKIASHSIDIPNAPQHLWAEPCVLLHGDYAVNSKGLPTGATVLHRRNLAVISRHGRRPVYLAALASGNHVIGTHLVSSSISAEGAVGRAVQGRHLIESGFKG